MSDVHWVFAAIVGTLSAARITRLFVWDSYPPSAWLRTWYASHVSEAWEPLMTCGYCFGLYASAFVLGTGWLSWWQTGDLHWGWWVFNGFMALGYAASIVMAYDGDD